MFKEKGDIQVKINSNKSTKSINARNSVQHIIHSLLQNNTLRESNISKKVLSSVSNSIVYMVGY